MPIKKRTKKKKKADFMEDKFRQCPACGGPIDYWNSCRNCGRPWTAELTETEKLERADEENERDLTEEEEPHKLVGAREDAGNMVRTQEEIVGKKAKQVGTSKKSNLPKSSKHWKVTDRDTEVEISRKRSLMRLDSRKVYNAMGLVARAHENQRAVLLWLSRLWEFLSEEEREEFAPTADMLKKAMESLTKLKTDKVAVAVEMERAVGEEHNKARQVRMKRAVAAGAGRQASQTRVTEPGADTEGFETVVLKDLGTEELMNQVMDRLALRDVKVQPDEELEDEDNDE